jgi:REP element-mobilizing transposase RayT
MARALRVQYPGAVHHVTSRGNERKRIFRSDVDRRRFIELLAEAVQRFAWRLSAWVLMPNHFHLVLETPEHLTLSDGMQWLNGTYAEWFNSRHKRVGHLFQGRFKSFLIEKEAYLQNVARYVVLNPVRAGMVQRPEAYRWSSYRATAGLEPAPEWLDLSTLACYFGDAEWQSTYRDFVDDKVDSTERLWDQLVNGIYIGTTAWLKTVRKVVESKLRSDEHPATQRAVGRPEMATIIDAVAKASEVTADEIRHGHGGAARMVTAWLGRWQGWARLRSIAASLRLDSCGRASDLIDECELSLRGNADLQGIVDRAYAILAAS